MQRFSDLIVWQHSHEIALEVYRLTDRFPATERFGLVTQLRRAAVSVCANIAEGAKRAGPRDYAHFLNVAEGSVAEVQCLLALSRDLGYAPAAEVQLNDRLEAVARMIYRLRQRVSPRRSAVDR